MYIQLRYVNKLIKISSLSCHHQSLPLSSSIDYNTPLLHKESLQTIVYHSVSVIHSCSVLSFKFIYYTDNISLLCMLLALIALSPGTTGQIWTFISMLGSPYIQENYRLYIIRIRPAGAELPLRKQLQFRKNPVWQKFSTSKVLKMNPKHHMSIFYFILVY